MKPKNTSLPRILVCATAACLAMYSTATAQAAVIAGWDVSGISTALTSVDANTHLDSNLTTPVTLTFGAGFNAATPFSSHGFQAWSDKNNAGAFDPSKTTYFQFTLTPQAGYSVEVDSINELSWQIQNAKAETIYMASSLDNYAAAVGSATPAVNGYSLYTWSITPTTPLVSSTALTIRLYVNSDFGYCAAGLAGTQYGNNAGDSLEINGMVSAVPEPTTWALLALSLTGVVIFRRRRLG